MTPSDHAEDFIYKEFWKLPDGTIHKEGSPAIIWLDGSEFWYQEGELHREDGPAVIRKDSGLKKYFLKGQEMLKEEFIKILAKKRIQKIR